MKNTACFFLLFLYLLCCLLACSKSTNKDEETNNMDDSDPITKLTIENDKVICETCDGFGSMLETYQNQVFVGGKQHVWIFDYTTQGITLSQEIDLTNFGSLNSITAKDGMLFLGLFDDIGTGSVRQYAIKGLEWQFTRNYEIGRYQDSFGNDIAISDTLMVIGASAGWRESVDISNKNEGTFYIYKKDGADWVQTQEFYSENRFADDRFGTDVVITENLILVGGLSIPMHIYTFEETEWKLVRVENDIVPTDIANFENTVLYYSEMLGLQSFTINTDGSINSVAVNANLDLGVGMPYDGDGISMTENHALITSLGAQQVYLLKFENNEWTLSNSYGSDLGQQFEFTAIKLNENIALISGTDYSDYKSYLYFNTF
ncbi:hypothetical protein GH721_03145 [Kriegella sp. EG-1]|nr:hypothetical protein [Flavobacteriaceae bacterium EG-1]